MSEKQKQPATKELFQDTYRMVLVGSGLTGCLTVLILGAALFLGFWLDKTFESANRLFTIGLVILSVPLTIVALLWVVRFTASRFKSPKSGGDAQEEILQEDADSV